MHVSPRTDKFFVIFIALVCLGLYLLPTGFPEQEDGYSRSRAEVVDVDNSNVHQRGVVKTGVQGVTLVLAEGPLQGQQVETTNPAAGQAGNGQVFYRG